MEAECTCPHYLFEGINCYKCPKRVNLMQEYARRVKAEIVGWDSMIQRDIEIDRFRAAGGFKGNVAENTKEFKESKGLWINPVLTEEVRRKIHIVDKYFL